MKQYTKNLLSIAIAAALVPGLAVQADDGNVTLYGKARSSVNFTDNGTDNVTDVSSNASRLGFKGKEDLGNGLKAVFQFETLIFLDDGAGSTGTLFGTARNSYVGVASGLGTLLLGIIDNPYKLSTSKLDIYGDSMGDFNAIMGNVSGASTPFDEREPNGVNYWSPKINGFQFMAGYRFDEDPAVSRGRYSVNASYENGPFYGSIAYETHKDEATAAGAISGAGREFDTEGWKAGLGYAFNQDKTKLGLVYEKLSQDGAATLLDRDAWYVALSHKIDNNTLKIAYANAGDSDAAGDDSGADWFVMGLDHSLSKRTTLYALYAQTNNESGARYGLGTGGSTGAVVPAVAGQDPSTFSVGINHDF